MQCFPKSRAVPTEAEDKWPQLLGTNALEEEACVEFPEKGPWFLLVCLPPTPEVSVLEVNKHPADMCPCASLRRSSLWENGLCDRVNPMELCWKHWWPWWASQGLCSALHSDSGQQWAAWEGLGWERHSEASGNIWERKHKEWCLCLTGPDSFVCRGGVCETGALAQPRSGNNLDLVILWLQVILWWPDPVQQPQEMLWSGDWPPEGLGIGSLPACTFPVAQMVSGLCSGGSQQGRKQGTCPTSSQQ